MWFLTYFAPFYCIFWGQKDHLPGVTVSLFPMTAFPVAISSPFLVSLVLMTACGLAASFAPSYTELLMRRKNIFLVSLVLMTAFPVAISSPPSYTELFVCRKNTFLVSLV
jgi:hypothetical protein